MRREGARKAFTDKRLVRWLTGRHGVRAGCLLCAGKASLPCVQAPVDAVRHGVLGWQYNNCSARTPADQSPANPAFMVQWLEGGGQGSVAHMDGAREGKGRDAPSRGAAPPPHAAAAVLCGGCAHFSAFV